MTLSTLLPNLPWLTNLAARFTANTAEAEDCAMVAIERIAPRLEEFRTEPQARAFLAKTARNAAMDAHKATERRQRKEALATMPQEDAEAHIRLQMVIAYGIPQLTPERQKIATLWAEGAETREIAGKLGISEKTVRNQKCLIIRDLKRWVKRCKLV